MEVNGIEDDEENMRAELQMDIKGADVAVAADCDEVAGPSYPAASPQPSHGDEEQAG